MPPARSAGDRRAFRATAALCLALLLGLAWGLQRWTRGFEVWTYEGRRQSLLRAGRLQAPPVALRGIDGAAPRLWRASGAAPSAYLVDFIYTRCPGVCRALGSEYEQMQRAAGVQNGAVQLVSISIDPTHDDPAQLARYAVLQKADPRHWTLAVPATPAAADRLLRALGVIVVPDGQGGFVHNGAIHLLDARGRLRGLYAFDQWPQALAEAQALAAAPGQAEP